MPGAEHQDRAAAGRFERGELGQRRLLGALAVDDDGGPVEQLGDQERATGLGREVAVDLRARQGVEHAGMQPR